MTVKQTTEATTTAHIGGSKPQYDNTSFDVYKGVVIGSPGIL
jgi:hypothetical protein